tara:strand:+ start:1285 stop:2589 length:1305 start_codon:yes stop_codon:yes gene_type:complete
LANIYITKEIAFSEFKSEHFKDKTASLANEAIQLYENEGLKALRQWYRHTYRKEGLKVTLLDNQLEPIGLNPHDFKNEEAETNFFPKPKGFNNHLLTLADHQVTSSTGKSYTLRILPSPALRSKFNPETLHLYRFFSSFIIIFAGSFWLYRSIAKPLKVLHKASVKLSEGNFSVRTMPTIGTRKDELGQLAIAFDQMAIKIEALLTNQKQLFRDISHEIRTPLTRQKLAIELAKDCQNPIEYLEKIERQNEHIDTLINNLLTLMKLEDAPLSEFEIINVNSILETIILEAELDLQAKKITLVKQGEANCIIHGDSMLLTRALENILMNAIKYSPENKQIQVVTKKIAEKVMIIISDQGPGIPENDLEHILKPFYRSDQSRNQQTGGYGLGLAIAQKIILQHHGRLLISNVKPCGLEVNIELCLLGMTDTDTNNV